VVGPASNDDIAVNVPSYSNYNSDAGLRVLQDPALLDVQFDPTKQVVENVSRMPPVLRSEASGCGVVPEGAPVVSRSNSALEVFFRNTLRDNPTPEQHLAEPGALFFKEADELEWQPKTMLLA